MAGNTTFYRMAYFDFGDELDAPINVDKEIRRFTFLDSQLYGMFNVFGNGIISGWSLYDAGYSDTTGISVGITAGSGVISYTACQTVAPFMLGPLPPSQTLYIYAVSTSESPEGRDADFTFSTTILTAARTILLGTVTTSANGISSIDLTSREYIGFAQYIDEQINTHKHRGSPSKIDLVYETKNELPGASVENFDASKISTGQIPNSVLPVIDHTSLSNKGILTHPQLDTLTAGLTSSSNVGLVGEVMTVNMMRTLISLKYNDTDIDRYLINNINYIPEITKTLPDAEASTAYIDDVDGYIVGLPIGDDKVSYFYLDNLYLPGKLNKIIVTANSSIPDGGAIAYGVNTTNSTAWSNYQAISENEITSVTGLDNNLRLGIKFTSPSGGDQPYGVAFEDYIDFVFINEAASAYFDFRIRFYEDPAYTNLYTTIFSQNSQEGWIVDDSSPLPCNGQYVANGDSVTITYYPDPSDFVLNKTYYLIIDAWNGSSFVSEMSGYTFVYIGGTGSCPYSGYPFIRNLSFMFELANGKSVKLNL